MTWWLFWLFGYLVIWLFWTILVNFGAFCCPSCATPWPLHDLYWLLYPLKSPSNIEKDHISHSGKIQNSSLNHESDHFGPFWFILDHFGAYCCTSCRTAWPLHDLYWLPFPFKCPYNPEKDHISHSGQIRNTFELSWYGDHFGPFWSILVHIMGDPTTPLDQIVKKSSKICILCIKSFKTRPVLPS